MVKVTVKPLKGDTFEVEYEEDILVKALKEKIAAVKPEMTADLQKLIYSGRILENDKPVKEYSIKEGEFIVVMIMKAKAPAAAAAPAAAPAAPAATTPESTATPAAAGNAEQIAASAMPQGNAAMDSTVEMLMGMGFERPAVENCLRAAFGNPDRAVEYLMNGIPAGLDEPMAQAGGAPPPAAGGGGGAPPPAAGGGATPNAMPNPFSAMPTGGAGGDGGGGGAGEPYPPALEALRSNPMFPQLSQMAAQNPAALSQMLPMLQAQYPDAALAIRENPEAFQRMLREAAGGAGGGGGGGAGGMGGGMGGMDPAAMMAQMQNNPEMMQQIIAEVAESNPELAAQIQNDPQAFARMMQAAAAQGGGGGGGPGGGGGGQQVVRLTEEEGQAVARLQELGFDRQVAAQAYLACDKNEELAANYLFEHGMDDDA